MSVSSGEFVPLADEKNEEEKIRRHSIESDEDGVVGKDARGGDPPSALLVIGDDEGGVSPGDRDRPQLHAPPVGIRPGHHYPSSVQAPKPLSSSMEERLKNKSSPFSSFFSSRSSPPPQKKEGGPGPATETDEEAALNPNDEGLPPKTNPSNQPTPSAAFVVCGVDGTVYTLDAFTGQLRGMFASGPSLVYSSSPDEDAASKDDDVVDSATSRGPPAGTVAATMRKSDNDGMEGGGGEDSMNEHLHGDASNAIISDVSPGWKERVVPGLDGKLYSLYQMVGAAGVEEDEKCQAAEDGEYDDLDCDPSSRGEAASSDLPRLGTYQLNPLPISAMDVVDSPISTCRPNIDGEPQQEQCGIIMGSKKTTIYAIDTTTGKVRWTQDPNGRAGGRGFTTHPPKNTASRGGNRAVLLQREDFAVRHLDTNGGEEVWKVELGRFSALDFDVDASSRSSSDRSASGPESNSYDDASEQGDRVAGGRRRGAAAAAASVGSKEKKQGVTPILGGRKTPFDFDSGFGDNRHSARGSEESLIEHEDDFDHAHFRGFPSVAFGEDGTSLMAVDGISGELLWKRRIESVIAAVYGVGKESSWIPLDVIDESDVLTYGHTSAQQRGQGVSLIQPSPHPTASPHSGGLVPYAAGQLHQIGRHQSNLFVKPKFDPFGVYDELTLAEPGKDYLPYSDELDTHFPPVGELANEFQPTENRLFTPPGMTETEIQSPPYHILESGLYLTWSMVTAIIVIVVTLVIFVARIVILRQKRKYENTPSLDPTSAPNSNENAGGDFLLPAARNLTAPSSGNIWAESDLPLVTRSFSLDALGSGKLRSSCANVPRPLISEGGGALIPLPDISAPALPKPRLERGTSTTQTPTAVATTATSSRPRSMTLPTEEGPEQQRARAPSVDNIDGIPLVRYSRYRSEFEVISPLGCGGFGTVFRCENTLDGRHYAIKKIKILSQLGMDGTVTKHFSQKLHRVLREVKILALLDHPNIVRYYTAWLETDDGAQSEDDETNTTSSMFDRKSNGFFSSSIFSGFGSSSRAKQTSFSPQRSSHRRSAKGFNSGKYNPLGWNNFGSFRLDESKSEASSSFGAEQEIADPLIAATCEEEDDDLGFTWERSNETTADPPKNAEMKSLTKLNQDIAKEENSQTGSAIGCVDRKDSTEKSMQTSAKRTSAQSKSDNTKTVKLIEPKKDGDGEKKTMEGRHILFIQMQLCSVQTLADFLSNRQARRGSLSQSLSQSASYAVDIPYALRLFAQITNGVKYVHKQGLIHRDLKPQNCFIDDAGNVKVGDFGLSRESSTAGGITDFDENVKEEVGREDSFAPPDGSDAENTAGVGTRAYASPEQMRGSNYDASTDLFSLGLILFELCYPMYTSMERYKEFGGIRKGHFPTYWNSHVKTTFPTMHDLLVQMISDSAGERPSADAVSDHVESLLREYSVQSLDKSWGKEGVLFLRVEAEEKEGVLGHAMKLIKDAAPLAKILQYGLRGQASKAIVKTCNAPNLAIMEFAIEIEDDEKSASVEKIGSRLHQHNMTVRQISCS